MSFFMKPKKKADAGAEEPAPIEVAPTNYVVMMSVEKDLLVGAKKQIAVPLTIPALPELELTWEVTVRRANVGVSAAFLPDDHSKRSTAVPISTIAGSRKPESAEGEKRGFLGRFRRQSSKAESEQGDDDDDDASVLGRKRVEMPLGAYPVHQYEVSDTYAKRLRDNP